MERTRSSAGWGTSGPIAPKIPHMLRQVDLARFGQFLPGLPPASEEFRSSAVDEFADVPDRKGIAALDLLQFLPADRRGDRSAFAGARRIGHHRRRPALVAQPVEKDAALALVLADVGGEAFRLRLGNRPGEMLGKFAYPGPGRRCV